VVFWADPGTEIMATLIAASDAKRVMERMSELLQLRKGVSGQTCDPILLMRWLYAAGKAAQALTSLYPL
jgi:hypothetical protein